MIEAKHWEAVEGGKTRCRLCPHQCLVGEGKAGLCQVKQNVGGKLMAAHYGMITAMALDPMEKKPLYHFHPGTTILSIGTFGCNLACDFCQNHHLWDGHVSEEPASPERIVAAAKRERSRAIAYTYNEPYMSFEYVLDTARLAHEQGLKNVLVTNGFYNPEPLEELLPYIDAMNIDLKSMRDDFYQKLCRGRVEPVKRTIERAVKACMVEVTNLIITNENDSDQDLADLIDYIAGVSPDLPLHFSSYHPMFKRDNPATPISRLIKAHELAKKKLHHVYLGNVIADVGSDSFCHHCKAVLVHRVGYRIRIESLKGNKCGKCGAKVNFVSD